MQENLTTYQELAENLYSPITPEDGVSIEEIEKREKYLGFRLPSVLREFYLLVGNHEAINFSFNQLISINNLGLDFEDDRVIFYEENQGVCYWAIKVENTTVDNPPVWMGQSIADQDELDWHLASAKLTDFLLMMLCWQSVMGGLPFVGVQEEVDDSVVQTIKKNFSLIEVKEEHSSLQAFVKEGKVICLASGNNTTSIYAGAKSDREFLEIEDLLQIEWDYCSLDD